MPPSRPLRYSLIAAIVVHAIVFMMAPRANNPAAVATSPTTDEVSVAEIELLAAEPPLASRPLGSHVQAAPSNWGGVSARQASTKTSTHGAVGLSSGPSGSVEADPVAAAGGWTFSATGAARAPIDLQLDGGVALRVAAATARGNKRGSTGGVVETLEAHAANLGIGTGEVLAAAERAVRYSNLSNFSDSTWEVDTDSAGRVIGVHVMDATRDHAIWDQIARTAMNGVVVSGAAGPNGLTIAFHIDVAEKFPDGALKKYDFGVDTPLTTRPPPPISAIDDGRPQAPGVLPLVALTMKFDPTNIGAWKTRNVASHVLWVRSN